MPPQLRAWAQLVRIPNTLTACADVLAGFTLVAGQWWSTPGLATPLLIASIASICLYWAGMALNDVNDVEVDRAQRRKGPLVLEQISVQTARFAGWALLLTGLSLAGLSGYLLPDAVSASPRWLLLVIGVLLASTIVAYDSPLKAKWIGPMLMGLCRGLNLWIGVALGICSVWPSAPDWMSVILATAGHVAFVTGITMAARREGMMQQSPWKMLASWSVSLGGVALIALCSWWTTSRPLRLDPLTLFPLLVFLLALPWLRRAMKSIHEPGIGTLVPAIKQAILTIIFLDASIALQYGGNIPGIIVCALAIPTLAMSRIFRVT